MNGPFLRRDFLKFTAASLAASPAAAMADGPRQHSFTMDLNCGAIGVGVPLPEAIALAGRFGFEAVDPDAGFLARQGADEIQKLRTEMATRSLVWGAAGLTVDFRGEIARFQSDLKSFPAIAAALERAGVTRLGTWIGPAHRTLT